MRSIEADQSRRFVLFRVLSLVLRGAWALAFCQSLRLHDSVVDRDLVLEWRNDRWTPGGNGIRCDLHGTIQ